MQYKIKQISKGDNITIDYETNATVDSVEDDIKNEMPGVTYTCSKGSKGWCYLEQITNLQKNAQKNQGKEIFLSRPSFSDLRIGDKIEVEVTGGGKRSGVICDLIEEMKNGMDGVDYEADGESFWAYADQVISASRTVSNKKPKL